MRIPIISYLYRTCKFFLCRDYKETENETTQGSAWNGVNSIPQTSIMPPYSNL